MHRCRLVTLSSLQDGRPILVSVDHIVLVSEREGQDGCTVLLSTTQMLDVQESKEQVDYLIVGN